MPRPTISGVVIRQIDLNHSSPGKDKDYRITISQLPDGSCCVYTEHGPAGRLQNGKQQTVKPVPSAVANDMANQIRDQKRHQTDSYSVVCDQLISPSASNHSKPAEAPKVSTRRLPSSASLSPASRQVLTAYF